MKIIAGRINSSNITRYWLANEINCKVGDYAIVENANDYDLIKVVGIIETTEELCRYITNVNVTKKSNENSIYLTNLIRGRLN